MKEIDLQTVRSSAQLADVLRQMILDRQLRTGERLPSERELRDTTGLSRMTVRRAIETLIESGLVYRVAGSGTFVGAPSNDRTQTSTLGLIVPTFANSLFAELTDRIEREMRRFGYGLSVARSEFDPRSEAELLNQYAATPQVKGVLVVPTSGGELVEAYRAVISARKPLVFVIRQEELDGEGIDVDSVVTDHVRGARDVVRHLIALGHTRIAYVGSARPRYDTHYMGYQRALAEAGIPLDPALVITPDLDAETAGHEAVRLLLTRQTPFTAVFARIDSTAIHVMRALLEAGLRVPGDVSVVGFDNIETARHLSPPLTTVDHALGEVGRLAIWLMLDRIEDHYDGPGRQIIISPRLILRDSTAPKRRPR
jgi:LacI family transcriptional regulator